jgi:hypothetical protein
MGVDPANLLVAAKDRSPLPTFTALHPIMSAAVSNGTRGTHSSY